MGQTRWDVIVVGGGTAGCVLASRLSEVRSRRGLLLEAGKSHPSDGYRLEFWKAQLQIARARTRKLSSMGNVGSSMPGNERYRLARANRAHMGNPGAEDILYAWIDNIAAGKP